ncbi:MAG: S8 family serine peptidase [Alphaproteobacteria bacterium]
MDQRRPRTAAWRICAAALALGMALALGASHSALAQGGAPPLAPPGGNVPPSPMPPSTPDPTRPDRDPVRLPPLPSLPNLPVDQAIPTTPGPFVENQVLLLIPLGSPPGAPQQIAAPIGLSVLREFDLQSLGLRAAVLSIPAGLDVVTAIEFLTLTPNALAQPVYRYQLAAGPQYALDLMQVSTAHQFATGAQVTVAVIDTAVDVGHPAIAGRIAGIQDFVGANAPDAHGTAVAGLIAGGGAIAGVAPGARILALTAFAGGTGGGTSDRIAQAIDYAITAGARVINMSFSGPTDPVVTRLTQVALGRGRVVVAAAGNGGPNAPPSWPAAVPGVIAVTATGPDDRLYGSANHGSYISLAAPGVDVLSIAPQGRVGILSGTSMAAAHVSGLVALLLERHSSASPAQIRSLLERTAVDLGPPGRDTGFGAGRVDIVRALQTGP